MRRMKSVSLGALTALLVLAAGCAETSSTAHEGKEQGAVTAKKMRVSCAQAQDESVADSLAETGVDALNVRVDRAEAEARFKRNLSAACVSADRDYRPYQPVRDAYPDPVAGTEDELRTHQ